MGKGEIARYEQFLLFPQCFQKTFAEDTFGKGLNYDSINPLPNGDLKLVQIEII